tara:strand:- start:10831 stop:11607 length:777 start_codon:yes stop_codon:yes gene_type:complete
MEKTKEKKKPKVVKDTWEIKDRFYYLLDNKNPLTFTIPSRHSRRYPLLWFDEEKGYNRELRYATNQRSPFVDEQDGQATLKHIIFTNGTLAVKKSDVVLQKFLALHPANGLLFSEKDEIKEANNSVVNLEIELDAMNLARDLDIDFAEAVLRVEQGSKVSTMSSSEIKRDILVMARKNPLAFIDIVNDDNIQLRNIGIKAVELGLLSMSEGGRAFNWASNNRKLMNVPFDENPYSALAAWFKTDEGVEVLQSIQKKLK